MGLYPRDPLYPPSFSEDGRTSTVNALPAHAEEPLLIRQSAMFNIEMAALPQCFSDRRCIEALPPKGFGQHTVNVSAILRILLWIVCLAARAVGSWATGAAASTQGGAATAATGLRRERGAAGEASAQRSQQRQTTGRPPSSPEKWTKESSAERRCGRWGDRWSGPRKRHRRTSSYERRRALCGPVPRSGSAD